MSETWQVIDEAGEVHNVNVGQVRDSTAWRAWVGAVGGAVVHDDARGAVVLAAMRDGVDIAEVLAPGERSREEMAAEVAHLEDRRGALLAEIDRLAGTLGAVGHAVGAESCEREVLLAAIEEACRAAWYDGVREMRGAAGIHAMRWGARSDDAVAIFDLPPPILTAVPGAPRCGCDACGGEEVARG